MRILVLLLAAIACSALAAAPAPQNATPPAAKRAAPPPEQVRKQLAADLAKVELALPTNAPAAPKQPRTLLVFTAAAGCKHDSSPLCAATIELLGRKSGAYTTTVSADPAMFNAAALARFDAVLLDNCTGDFLTDETQRKNLIAFVRNGKGLIGIHAATDAFYTWPEYGEMIGGFCAGSAFREIMVKNESPQHPINAAFDGQDFRISDEIYTFKAPYSREKVRVLLSIDYENSPTVQAKEAELGKPQRPDHDYALSWIREFGKGRVFYCAFGHDSAIYWNPAILRHYLAGIQYALGDLPGNAVPLPQPIGAAAQAPGDAGALAPLVLDSQLAK